MLFGGPDPNTARVERERRAEHMSGEGTARYFRYTFFIVFLQEFILFKLVRWIVRSLAGRVLGIFGVSLSDWSRRRRERTERAVIAAAAAGPGAQKLCDGSGGPANTASDTAICLCCGKDVSVSQGLLLTHEG